MPLAELAEDLHIASAAAAKAVVVANHKLLKTEAFKQNALDELGRVERRECRREGQDGDVLETAFGDALELFLGRGEQERCSRRIDYLQRMREKGDQEARQRAGRGALDDPREQILVADVNAVEGTDGDHGT